MKKTLRNLVVLATAILLFLLCAPLLVNVLFMYEAPCAVLEARFDAGDLLGFIGSAAIGAGSLVLALCAIGQTERIDKLDRDMQNRQDRFERENTKRPFFVIEQVLVDDEPIQIDDDKGIWANKLNGAERLCIEIRNVGDGPACRFRLREDSAFGNAESMDQHRMCIPQDGLYRFGTSIANIERRGDGVTLKFRYENITGCCFSQQADIKIFHNSIYGDEQIETEGGKFVYEIVDESLELSVSSLTAQVVESAK